MHCPLPLIQIAWLIYFPCAFGVKIGVSRVNTTTTTTTSEPILSETIIIDSTTKENFSEVETTTYATKSIRTTTTELEFPPKITTKSTRKGLTPVITTSTTIPEPTTTAASVTETNASNVDNNSILDSSPRPKHFYCFCNLMPSSCDINCCCDPDCNKDALKVFNCFLPSKNPELRVRLEDFQYEHGLPSCKINDGWLCVFRTNIKPPAAKVVSYNFDTARSFKWSNSLTEVAKVERSIAKEFYKYGDPINLIDKNTLEIRNFELPYAFKPPYCKLRDPIRFLTQVERHCLASSFGAAKHFEEELNFLKDTTKLLTRPKTQFTYDEDIADHLVNIQVKILLNKQKNEMDRSMETKNFSNETEIDDLQGYYIEEITIKISHNFTDILNCLIEVKFQEISDNETEEPIELWQKYTVKFMTINATASELTTEENNIRNRLNYSGPLGYLKGEPMIIAKYITNNEGEELSPQKSILNYFKEPTRKLNTLRVLARQNGFCQQSSENTFSLNYGISSLHQCNFQMPDIKLRREFKNTNATNLCLKIQQHILTELFDRNNIEDLTELYVSMLGHPQNTTEKWLQLQVKNLDFYPVVGQFIARSQSLICRNILLSAAYEFHIGTFTEQGVPYQALVKHAVLKLGQRHDLEFAFEEQLEVPLTLTVMFYDLAMSAAIRSFHVRNALFGIVIIIFSLELF